MTTRILSVCFFDYTFIKKGRTGCNCSILLSLIRILGYAKYKQFFLCKNPSNFKHFTSYSFPKLLPSAMKFAYIFIVKMLFYMQRLILTLYVGFRRRHQKFYILSCLTYWTRPFAVSYCRWSGDMPSQFEIVMELWYSQNYILDRNFWVIASTMDFTCTRCHSGVSTDKNRTRAVRSGSECSFDWVIFYGMYCITNNFEILIQMSNTIFQ